MIRTVFAPLTAALLVLFAFAQQNESWKRPFPAHRIAGNVYYVGTEDLACFLITTEQGHILINTGLEDSAPQMRKSVENLGFRFEDIRILLTMQAHFDHVGAMAEIQKLTGAQVFASEGDAPALEDGGKSDPHFGNGARFRPMKVHRRLKQADVVRLGSTELNVISTPGHSKGSVSYTMKVSDGGKIRSLAIVNMLTVVMPLSGNPKYPDIVRDFRLSFTRQKQLKPDIWVAAHASQYRMQEKFKTGSFVDPDGYTRAVLDHERRFSDQLRRGQQSSL
jgi:metallo-beta-lactamase class B